MYQSESDRKKLERPEKMLALIETEEDENKRLLALRADDPISYQDAKLTSDAFLEAAKEGDLAEIQRIVKDAEPEELLIGPVAMALLTAISRTDLPLVEYFIQQGMTGWHPGTESAFHILVEATEKDNFANAAGILELLSKNNWDINEPRRQDGFTPLCVACMRAHAPLAYVLVQKGARVNVSGRKGETPLSVAQTALPTDGEQETESRKLLYGMLKSKGAKATVREMMGSRSR
jgi:hypothetical protein